jgi:ATP-dependent helicase/nuclease subunit B
MRMFSELPHPRVFAQAPGVDFPAALVAGMRDRLSDQPPEAMAHVTLIVNTQRMRRRIVDLFVQSGAGFLPKIRLVTDLGKDAGFADIPPAIPALRTRLLMSQAIDGLLTADPSIAPRTALFDLADSLATLMDEMRGEGVSPAVIAGLDVSGHSAHWRRTQDFLGIMAGFFDAAAPPDVEARQRLVVMRLVSQWQAQPPDGPIILAGSTGSRGTTALLMQAVARLPQGAVVLPGFDWDQPAGVWDALNDAKASEDHPQFRFHTLLRALQISAPQVTPWHDVSAPNADRNRLISLALRPAPVTDQWMRDGPKLQGLANATKDMTLIEAASPRAEALAISMILRQAVETGQKAALITPDRNLTRMVAASLDRWGILPDDSAGRPLALSPPGRFLRQVANLAGKRLTSEALLALLKHPLTHSGQGRGDHLRWTRLLERHIRNRAQPYPTAPFLADWAGLQTDGGVPVWVAWLTATLLCVESIGDRAFADHVTWHQTHAETLARGAAETGTGGLWEATAGGAALRVIQTLVAEAAYAGEMSPFDYATLFSAVLDQAEPVRDALLSHPDIMIWGTLEARVQGADLVILGGLNEGVWPGAPAPDPWLNRDMRMKAGLLLPDRQIGLSAHDFQQAIAVGTVVMTRAKRNADAETVASRWVSRLTNLLQGLDGQQGPALLAGMRARGANWLRRAEMLEAPEVHDDQPAPRPSPRPPVHVRPAELPVTDMARLIRDPYAIYAKRILRLKRLPPLRPTADASLKGRVLHAVMEAFARNLMHGSMAEARTHLLALMQAELAEVVSWPAARALWFAKLERVVDFVLGLEEARQGQPILLEEQGRMTVSLLGFTLTARPDRIDLLADGRVQLIDYKSGTPPSETQQKVFDKQLLLTAVMAAHGAFGPKVPTNVAAISYIGLGATPSEVETEMTDDLLDHHWQGLLRLIGRYQSRSTGYTARRAMAEMKDKSDYDHLSRFGEWDTTDASVPQIVGDPA